LLLAIKKLRKGPNINATISAFFGFKNFVAYCREIFAAWLSLDYFSEVIPAQRNSRSLRCTKAKRYKINNHLFSIDTQILGICKIVHPY
jgi:hypothetical protein